MRRRVGEVGAAGPSLRHMPRGAYEYPSSDERIAHLRAHFRSGFIDALQVVLENCVERGFFAGRVLRR